MDRIFLKFLIIHTPLFLILTSHPVYGLLVICVVHYTHSEYIPFLSSEFIEFQRYDCKRINVDKIDEPNKKQYKPA